MQKVANATMSEPWIFNYIIAINNRIGIHSILSENAKKCNNNPVFFA